MKKKSLEIQKLEFDKKIAYIYGLVFGLFLGFLIAMLIWR